MGKREEKCMKTNTDLFEKVPVPKAVATMAVPTMISMLVVVIYNMADTFFIGQTNDPMKVAAVSLATPIFMVFMALGNLFGIGGSSAISRALGEHKPEKASIFPHSAVTVPWALVFYGSGFHFRNGTDLKTDRRQ